MLITDGFLIGLEVETFLGHWRIPTTEHSGTFPSIGSEGVVHNGS